MNDEKNQEQKPKNSVLFENQSYNESLALKEEQLKEKDETIAVLEKQIGERDKIISAKDKETDVEKTARIRAENLVTQMKGLDKSVDSNSPYVYKTEEQKFSERYKEASRRVRGK